MKTFLFLVLLVISCFGSLVETPFYSPLNEFTLVFYNVENLFDTINDPGTGDDEFSKYGIRNWNAKKYISKLNKIAQAILSANNWNFPDIIALAEIENRSVIDDLYQSTLLKKGNYEILHQESPDHRGIDVALLYNPDKFECVDNAFYHIKISKNSFSRDILYARMRNSHSDFHLFVCHWPSRYGGVNSSQKNRMHASDIVKHHIQNILNDLQNPLIIAMGDFNDEPENESVGNITNELMYNMMQKGTEQGTIKYQNQWYVFDQFWVSKFLYDSKRSGYKLDMEICHQSFLLVDDKRYLGLKPFRTYYGYRYQGGYSDHLPILLKVQYLND